MATIFQDFLGPKWFSRTFLSPGVLKKKNPELSSRRGNPVTRFLVGYWRSAACDECGTRHDISLTRRNTTTNTTRPTTAVSWKLTVFCGNGSRPSTSMAGKSTSDGRTLGTCDVPCVIWPPPQRRLPLVFPRHHRRPMWTPAPLAETVLRGQGWVRNPTATVNFERHVEWRFG